MSSVKLLSALLATSILSLAPPAAAQDAVDLRIMTFNIQYGGEEVGIDQIAREIDAADPDVVGLQEADGSLEKIAAAAGYRYYDIRRRILSRYPIFDSASGVRTDKGRSPDSITGLDRNAVHDWIMVRPGKVIALANVHLSSDPSGYEPAYRGMSLDKIMRTEAEVHVPEVQALAELKDLAARGIPTFLTGDFNTPSHLDWTAAAIAGGRDYPRPVPWAVSTMIAGYGLKDSYRVIYPDPVARPGLTWTPAAPSAPMQQRIDFIYAGGMATATGSKVVGEPGGPDVDIAISPYPSDHRAVVSTFRVTPADAPAMVSVSPRIAQPGDSLFLRGFAPTSKTWSVYVVPAGGTLKDVIESATEIVPLYRTSMRLPTLGLKPGAYDVILTGDNGAPAARTRFDVASGAPQLTLGQAVLARGGSLSVHWDQAPGEQRDWLGIYRVGDPDVQHYLAYLYTQAQVTGESAFQPSDFKTPLAPGRYEVRLMRDETFVTLAVATFEVKD